jgi:hypothetical protein
VPEGEVEFDCIDCGDLVIMFGTDQVPDPARCAVCTWIVATLPPAEHAAIRERLGHPLKARRGEDSPEQPTRPAALVARPNPERGEE